MTGSDFRLVEGLLHEEESQALDFKRDQYAFEGTDDQTKSELLKDILAFCNAWRRSTAYILIGIEEVKGGRGEVVGVTEHLDDASLQECVDSKTQRPVDFSYRQIRFEGVELGVIEIPEQKRPIYLNKKYGKVSKKTVYIRRGSSTRIADPDEILRMGEVAVAGIPTASPQLDLQWADLDAKTGLPSPYTVKSLLLDPLLPDHTFTRKSRAWPASTLTSIGWNNPNYSNDVISYTADMALLAPLGLLIRNTGGVVGKRIMFDGAVARYDGMEIREYVERPQSSFSTAILPPPVLYDREPDTSPRLIERDDRWEIVCHFGDVRPHETVFCQEVLFFGSRVPATVRLEGELIGDNVPEPISCALEICFKVDQREMRIEDVEQDLDSLGVTNLSRGS